MKPRFPSVFGILNECSAVAVLNLLRVTNRSLSASDISTITQATLKDITEVIDLLDMAGLMTIVRPSRHSDLKSISGHLPNMFSLSDNNLLQAFEEHGWEEGFFGSRLAVAYAGAGQYSLAGWKGQDNFLERLGYLETDASPPNDYQVSKITLKGMAAYVVLTLLYPRNEASAKVA